MQYPTQSFSMKNLAKRKIYYIYIYLYKKKRRVKHEFSSVAKRTYEYKYIKATVTIKRIGGRGDRRSKPSWSDRPRTGLVFTIKKEKKKKKRQKNTPFSFDVLLFRSTSMLHLVTTYSVGITNEWQKHLSFLFFVHYFSYFIQIDRFENDFTKNIMIRKDIVSFWIMFKIESDTNGLLDVLDVLRLRQNKWVISSWEVKMLVNFSFKFSDR